jgi:membrane-bound serine protease (ClpP class)
MRACSGPGVWRPRHLLAMVWVALYVVVLAAAAPAAQPRVTGPVIVLELDDAIGPATTEYVENGLKTARARGASLVVLRMDTPGGLDSATRDIVSALLASPVPVATYVSPAGARAASAGTYILYASHLAAMAPGTHLGAATPVAMGSPTGLPGGEPSPDDKKAAAAKPPDAMTAKVVNDAAAYIASLAALHGRNAEWAERAVREAATLTAEQAHAQKVVEVVAGDLPSLLAQAEGRTIRLAGKPQVLHVAGAGVDVLEPNWRTRLLAAITNPNIAYLLLLVGVYGLLFEFMSPGAVAPGIIGALALLTAFFALDLLPVNYAGLALLLLGVGLMAAEAYNPSVGAFGIGGVAAFALGSLMLFDTPAPGFRLSPGVLIAAVTLSLAYFILALGTALRARRRTLAIGPTTLLGAAGWVVSWSGDGGVVRLQGEDWRARGAGPLAPGQRVRVAAREGLALIVEPEP